MENQLFIGLLLGALLGVVLGVIAVSLVQKYRKPKPVRELEKAHTEFKEHVAEHFVKTADLVNQMTDSYKAVFDHLQGGAEQLVDEETRRERLQAPSEEVITLNRLGYSKTPAATDTVANDSRDSSKDRSSASNEELPKELPTEQDSSS